jgi:hypothetical protein
MRWAGHVALWERREVYIGFWWGNLGKRGHLGKPGVDGRIILRWILRMWDSGHGLECSGSGYEQLAGTCEYGDEPSGSIKFGKFLD